ncbi:Gfo/Idh/MocA family protein [Amycolatopsis sp. FDAARGOS 1241]|uniref:Gfo/Idh/MocA family protein n=1 Tax=Amycolatopsis sp. FDAARGOS 1241 TaxID=2778070 RepID=UPI00194EC3CA|nr:Gfo/Idh/MocA family oxidoreductase [Amycolatopsis sp. FDAARGOS 1241]QRP48500.1 Gfo/Idh/MocA family oxidoreductase [Amycolatopsis sp. FDAARGOS 1241]
MTEPVRIGLVGAGPWAHTMHAPTFAAGPDTTLTAVYARRAEAAGELAAAHGAKGTTDFDELLGECEAVAFAVRPDVQAALAQRAARAGKAVLLEKPVALTVPAARELAEAVEAAGVVSQLVLTKRYLPETRRFIERARAFDAVGARSCYLHGAFLGGDLATGWRLEHGALPDLGPHLLDLLETTLGPIGEIRAAGDSTRWIELTCRHESGAVSQASLSGVIGLDRARTTVELFGAVGALGYDTATIDHSAAWPILRAEFAAAVRTGRSPELDVWRGVRLQELIAQAEESLAA